MLFETYLLNQSNGFYKLHCTYTPPRLGIEVQHAYGVFLSAGNVCKTHAFHQSLNNV